MSSRELLFARPPALPRWLRAVLLVATTAILCSCQGPQTASIDPFKQRGAAHPEHLLAGGARASGPASGGPASAYASDSTGGADQAALDGARKPHVVLASAEVPVSDSAVAIPAARPMSTMAKKARAKSHVPAFEVDPYSGHPGGFVGPMGDCSWQVGPSPEYKLPPVDEVLCDGGDDGMQVAMLRDGTLAGLEMEDAVAHYRTLEGQTVIVPTNEVCIYAPRFGAVRQVSGASISVRNRGPEGMATDLALVGTEARFEPSTTKQHLEPAAGVGERPTSLLRGRQQGGGLENEEGISRATGNEAPVAFQQSIRFVLIDNRDQPLELGGMINAIHWTHDLGVQVIIDTRKAQVINSDKQVAFLYHVEERNKPRLKVVKLADRTAAHPGEIVHFQLRYENVGNRPITELTLVDNLTTRLEYVEGSQQSDRPAEFGSELNEGGSLLLRWEFQQPLEPGQGGVIEFDTRVR